MERLDQPTEVLAFLRGPARPDSGAPGLDVLLADEDGVALKVIIVIDDVPADPPQHDRVTLLGPLLRQVADRDVPGVALVVRRGGACYPEGGDLAWHDAFVGGCAVAGLICHGVYLATRHGACQVLPVARTGRPDAA